MIRRRVWVWAWVALLLNLLTCGLNIFMALSLNRGGNWFCAGVSFGMVIFVFVTMIMNEG